VWGRRKKSRRSVHPGKFGDVTRPVLPLSKGLFPFRDSGKGIHGREPLGFQKTEDPLIYLFDHSNPLLPEG
jgi:hypothetical protein